MTSYVALLRGINVGGHHKVAMADLRALFEAEGLAKASTYIQSGNVVFTSDEPESALVSGLAKAMEERFGFPIPVVLRDADELGVVAEAHPFANDELDERFLHVIFLGATPGAEATAAFDVAPYAPDRLVVRGRDVYVAYPNGSGRSKLTVDVIGRALSVTATGRNWRTVRELRDLAGDAG